MGVGERRTAAGQGAEQEGGREAGGARDAGEGMGASSADLEADGEQAERKSLEDLFGAGAMEVPRGADDGRGP